MLCTAAAGSAAGGRDILVLGSVNMDITVDVERLPLKGETTTSRTHTASLAVGGKVLLCAGRVEGQGVHLLHSGATCCAHPFHPLRQINHARIERANHLLEVVNKSVVTVTA